MTVSVLGGDLRMAYAAKKLQACGADVLCCGLWRAPIALPCASLAECLAHPSAVLLPFPYTKDQSTLDTPYGTEGISLDALQIPRGTPVFCGRADLPLRARAENGGWHLDDFCTWDVFLSSSAVLTAEGAIQQTMQHTKSGLCRRRAVVIGFGRIAKHLCRLLYAFGAHVCVCARKHTDRAYAKNSGYDACDFCDLKDAIASCHLLYNTVPSRVLGKDLLLALTEETLIIDLASPPGGVDFTAAKELHLSYIWALALPTLYAPIRAGEDLGEAIYHVLTQKKGEKA